MAPFNFITTYLYLNFMKFYTSYFNSHKYRANSRFFSLMHGWMSRTLHFLLIKSDILITTECRKDNHQLWVTVYSNSMCWKHDYQEGEDLRWKRFLMPSIGLLMRYIQNCGEHEKRSFCVAYLWPCKLCFRVVYSLVQLFSLQNTDLIRLLATNRNSYSNE